MTPVLEGPPGTLTVLIGNPQMTSLDGLYVAPLATLIAPATTDAERAAYGVYMATPFQPDDGYHVVGSPTYDWPDRANQPYYVQETYDVEADEPSGPTIEDRVLALEAAMPTKATNAPPAVAASSALGNVDTRFALENHEHGINATQQSQISALQSNVSSLLTLTSGLNTPAPATATPSASSGSGAVGDSSKYARENHVHPAPGVPVSASTGTSRALGTSWVPHATKAVLVTATINISTTTNVGGVSEGIVQCLSDSANPPTTLRGRVRNRNAITLAIALQQVNDNTFELTCLVPAGDRILFSGSGTGTFTNTLERVTEAVIG